MIRLNSQSGFHPVRTALPFQSTAPEKMGSKRGASGQTMDVHWAQERMPLSILMETPPREAFDSAVQLLHASLRQWESVVDGICFQTLAPNENSDISADITIRWMGHTTLGRDFEVGHTQRQVVNGLITQASIVLITQPLIDKQLGPQTQRQRLYATLLHELGHALGLEHSTNPDDVMHHRGWQHTLLSNNDINRLRLLYASFS